MTNGNSLFPIYGEGLISSSLGTTPRITSLLIKPASAVCNLDCAYCFYLDREADPYKSLPGRRMSEETLERLVDTFLFYSFPNSVFAFQGGEPTLAGLPFFEKLVKLQKQYGRDGQNVSNALQTNGMLLDESWCQLFKEYNWLIGLSMDGPEEIHDSYRFNKAGHGTWKRVMQSLQTMQKHKVDFNILCVLSQANVHKAREVYQYFKGLGIDNIQYIPLSEFDDQGKPLPFTISAEEYGRFMVETFDLWWPDRRKIRIRFFDNIAEALAGQKPGSCTMHETCDSYVVVEYNGDIYPCDFFVSSDWRLGNINLDSWTEIARKQRRYSFAKNKTIPHPECQVCEYQAICHGGCPKSRHAMNRDFADLDHFCQAYKMIFKKSVGPLTKEVEKILGHEVEPLHFHSISPY
ncbi:MAG: anaerobic sulfatase maturase [Bryobacterales bacterium]|nr:anaerobic sulfatase maturase [Bryobacterales bacterium]